MSFQITMDAQIPSRLARFWAQALPGYRVRDYDAAEIARLETRGLNPDTDPSVAIDGDGPTIWFQKADKPTDQRNRIHLDLAFAEPHQEARRLMALGAKIRDERSDHIVMLDPEGNQFCLFNK